MASKDQVGSSTDQPTNSMDPHRVLPPWRRKLPKATQLVWGG